MNLLTTTCCQQENKNKQYWSSETGNLCFVGTVGVFLSIVVSIAVWFITNDTVIDWNHVQKAKCKQRLDRLSVQSLTGTKKLQYSSTRWRESSLNKLLKSVNNCCLFGGKNTWNGVHKTKIWFIDFIGIKTSGA